MTPLRDQNSVQTVLDALPLALAVFDVDLRCVRANRRYAELTDLTPEQQTGRALHDAWPNAMADLEPQIATARRTGTPSTRLVEFRTALGTRTAEVTIARIPSAADGWVFIALDVTEREELRRTLARSVEELETIFATIPESVRVFGQSGEIVRLNARARAEHEGTPPMTAAALWQTDRPRGTDGTAIFLHEHPAMRALGGESVRGQQLVLKRAGGETTLDVSAEPLRDESGRPRGAVTAERDVTEQAALARRLADQIISLQEDRERERRLAAVGQLAAGVMHDVNNVLNPILAAAYLIDSFAGDANAVKEYTKRIVRAAEMGVSRLARLRSFIRQEPMDDAEIDTLVDLAQPVDEVITMAAPLWAGRDTSTAVRVQRNLASGAVIRGTAAELRAAVLNLVQNAVDAMPQGGTLTMETAVRETWAIITVRDTGTGMDPETRRHAFEPFFTTKGSRGTGLGLAEVYGIVRRHRGVAEIESEPGAGTLIRLKFPLATTVG
ncbi:MAG TPA: ATP-binding protein [Gemmatimonadaceae bacterium]|nr:ATP-binding protein [Gemmatimonadaceae bacterium]